MNLEKILEKIDYKLLKGNKDVVIKDIAYDSRMVCEGDLFICLVGSKVDGHDYIHKAIANGARAIVVSREIDIDSDKDMPVVLVDDTSKVLSRMSMNLFDNPHKKMTTIAITGTKGKTTTSFMIKRILEEAGYKCGLIGTTGIYIGNKSYPSKNTTPLSYDTLKYMKEMVDCKTEYVVMEVSSQALKYDRVNDIMFDYGVFTNLTQDHIGEFEHSDMEDYITSKAKLFKQCVHGVFNLDDNHFFEMVDSGESSINTYGFDERADLRVKKLDLYHEGHSIGINLELGGVIEDQFKISTPGKFSAYNAMGAILTCHLLGINVKSMKKALSNFSVRGRVEAIEIASDKTLLIDYAHNGASTESILTTIREYKPKRIVTIFGCGGNRSRDRRYEMGEIAGKYSDYCIITEDNNRDEEFEDIAKDILVGISKTKCEYKIIPDRKEAIRYAIKNGLSGDIIMLLGKGHEDYKEIKGVRYPFDERVIIKEILEEEKEKGLN